MRASENPFRHENVTQLPYHLEHTTWPALLEKLANLNYRAAVVGPYGSGKSCLLRTLGTHLEVQGFTLRFLRLSEERRSFAQGVLEALFAELRPEDLILFDEANQLSWWAWRCFKRNTRGAGGMVITSHRQSLLPTLIKCRTSPALLSKIVVELLGEEMPQHSDVISTLYRKHRGDIRAALHELYDRYADL